MERDAIRDELSGASIFEEPLKVMSMSRMAFTRRRYFPAGKQLTKEWSDEVSSY